MLLRLTFRGTALSLLLVAAGCGGTVTTKDMLDSGDMAMAASTPDLSASPDIAVTPPDMTELIDLAPLPPDMTAPKTYMVTVGANGALSFSPQSVMIHAGDSVKWTWGSSGHNVVSGMPGAPDSAFCSPQDKMCANTATSVAGFSYTHLFAAAGTFPYFCAPHSGAGMIGVVQVK